MEAAETTKTDDKPEVKPKTEEESSSSEEEDQAETVSGTLGHI